MRLPSLVLEVGAGLDQGVREELASGLEAESPNGERRRATARSHVTLIISQVYHPDSQGQDEQEALSALLLRPSTRPFMQHPSGSQLQPAQRQVLRPVLAPPEQLRAPPPTAPTYFLPPPLWRPAVPGTCSSAPPSAAPGVCGLRPVFPVASAWGWCHHSGIHADLAMTPSARSGASLAGGDRAGGRTLPSRYPLPRDATARPQRLPAGARCPRHRWRDVPAHVPAGGAGLFPAPAGPLESLPKVNQQGASSC